MSPLRLTSIVLAGLWAFGMATAASGGFIHILAVVALVILMIDFVTSRRVSD